MSTLKTQPSNKNVNDFVSSVEHKKRRQDSLVLLQLFEKITNSKPVLWGDSIVGYGSYHYKYASGREGDWPVTGFSPRKQNLSIYIMPGFGDYQPILNNLGKHKTSVSCLYINKLEDIQLDVLEQLIRASITDMQSLYTCTW